MPIAISLTTILVISISLMALIIACFWFKISKEIIVALIGASVIFIGYIYTTHEQINLQQYQLKAAAYDNFLNQLQANLHISGESTSTYNNKVNNINAAFMTLEVVAPTCVDQEIAQEVFNDSSATIGIAQIETMQLIFHEDLYGESNNCTSAPITTSSFMIFYPRQ